MELPGLCAAGRLQPVSAAGRGDDKVSASAAVASRAFNLNQGSRKEQPTGGRVHAQPRSGTAPVVR
jgi:hypothetical protein